MLRMELLTEIEIEAGAQRVWEILTDFAAYTQWNPMIRRASGELRVGARLEVRFEPEGSKGSTYRPKLLVVDPGRELRWLGWPRFPKFLDTDHYWIIEERPDATVRLEHGAAVFGLCTPVVGNRLLRKFRGPFAEMNQALKLRAEGGLVGARAPGR